MLRLPLIFRECRPYARLTEETLGLRLTFTTGDAMPPFMDDVRISVTMVPGPPAAGTDPDGTPFFMRKTLSRLTEHRCSLFAPATRARCCSPMWFLYPSEDPLWNTGLAITNPTAMGNSPLDGAVTFTLFPNDADSRDGASTSTQRTPGHLRALWTRTECLLRAKTYTVRAERAPGLG